MLDKKTHLLTHAGCMDGSGAAILFRHAGGDPKHIRWMNPGHIDEDLRESSVFKDPSLPILMVDIAPGSQNMVTDLLGRGNFQVIDHHGSSERFAAYDHFEISVGNRACGTEMFRGWLADNGHLGQNMRTFDHPSYRRLAHIIDDHDRWVLKHPMSRQMPRFFAFTGQQEFVERFMNVQERFADEKDSYWTPFEAEMLALVEKSQARRFNNLMTKFHKRGLVFEGRPVVVGYLFSGEVNNSELLHTYLDQNPDVDLACQINFDLNKVSLRSVDRVDITKFAAPFGGGGHRNSGGHPIRDGLVDHIISCVHDMRKDPYAG
jgi:oligoribonuclease NrnB/cAMP/cGMP phosphodiesterase (DHH superfamily)